MDVSIVTSLYGSASHLAGFLQQLEACMRTVESCGLSAESIIVSNAPDRRERRILRAALGSPWWADHSRLIAVPRETLYASWNRGVRASSGSAITFWNADDYRNPEAIVESVELIRQGKALVRLPWLNVVQRKHPGGGENRIVEIKDPDHDNALNPQSDFCLGPFFVFSRHLFEEFGPFDEQFHIVGDYDWQLRVVPHTGLPWGKRLGGVFFVDGTNLSSTGSQRLLAEQNLLRKRYELDRPPWPLDHRAEGLFQTYRVAPSQGGVTTSDWSYDRQWRRQRALSRIYHRCRRFVGTPIRLARSLVRASR